jgi:hypothetical protein
VPMERQFHITHRPAAIRNTAAYRAVFVVAAMASIYPAMVMGKNKRIKGPLTLNRSLVVRHDNCNIQVLNTNRGSITDILVSKTAAT